MPADNTIPVLYIGCLRFCFNTQVSLHILSYKSKLKPNSKYHHRCQSYRRMWDKIWGIVQSAMSLKTICYTVSVLTCSRKNGVFFPYKTLHMLVTTQILLNLHNIFVFTYYLKLVHLTWILLTWGHIPHSPPCNTPSYHVTNIYNIPD